MLDAPLRQISIIGLRRGSMFPASIPKVDLHRLGIRILEQLDFPPPQFSGETALMVSPQHVLQFVLPEIENTGC